jgi:hypothetical protein
MAKATLTNAWLAALSFLSDSKSPLWLSLPSIVATRENSRLSNCMDRHLISCLSDMMVTESSFSNAKLARFSLLGDTKDSSGGLG